MNLTLNYKINDNYTINLGMNFDKFKMANMVNRLKGIGGRAWTNFNFFFRDFNILIIFSKLTFTEVKSTEIT